MSILRSKNKLSLCALALGGLFLCDPIVGFRDVLPNFIGYALLFLGLWRLSDLNEDLADAMNSFRKLIWVSVGQLAVQWLAFDFLPTLTESNRGTVNAVNQYESPMLLLLATFVLALLTWLYLIPAFRSLFLGLGLLAMHGEAKNAVTQEKRGRAQWERLSRFSIAFAALMPALSLLPELSILTTLNLLSDSPTVRFDWYRFIWLFRSTAAIAAGILGLLWLIAFVRFFVRILRDRSLCETVDTRYEAEIAPRVRWLAYRRVSFSFALLTVGFLFCTDLYVDGYPIFHRVIPAVLLCIGLFSVRRMPKLFSLPFLAGGVILAVLGGIRWSLRRTYLADHLPEDARHIPRAYNEFFTVRVLEFVEWIVLCLFLAACMALLWRSVSGLNAEMEGAVFGQDRRKYAIKLCFVGVLLLASTVFGCLNAILQLEYRALGWTSLVLFVSTFLMLRAWMMNIRDEIFSCARAEEMHRTGNGGAY